MKNSISTTDRAAPNVQLREIHFTAGLLADAKDLLHAIDNGFVPGDPASAYVVALRRSVARMEAQK